MSILVQNYATWSKLSIIDTWDSWNHIAYAQLLRSLYIMRTGKKF